MAQYCLIFSSAPLFLYIIVISVLIPIVIPKPPSGFSLELIHRDSIQASEIITGLVKSSYLKENSKSNTNTQRLRFELAQDGNINFFVKLHFGNPPIPLYLLPDTASHLFWTQCEPCIHRYHQTSPIYNSTASHTYLKLPCEHPFCQNNKSTFKCLHGECVYRNAYGSGAITEGVASSDLFQPFDNTQMQINFGCSKKNQNFGSFELTGKIGGIMGLTMSPVSLLQQLSNITQHRFSYCFPPYRREGMHTTLLRFGDDIITRGRRFKSTPIISPPNQYKYFLNLQDISVEGHRMNFDPHIFAIKQGGSSGGCIIDSGTSVTRIIQPAYQTVVGAFQAYFDSHGLPRFRAPETGLDLCYKNSRRVPKASMTFHFEGADFKVEPQYIYAYTSGNDAFCVALLSSQNRTILGAMQQVNTRFIFDVVARQIFFSPENCEHDM